MIIKKCAMILIAQYLHNIKQQITHYEKQYQRKAGSVTLLAASKKQSIEKIKLAYETGQLAFGENYLQEALEKIEAAKRLQLNNIIWHFIGSIQSNKTKKIAEHFSWVHSIASQKIAKRLSEQRPLHLPPLNICIEVNLNAEPTKSGVVIDEVAELALYCHTLPHLNLRGLMTIPAPHQSFDAQRRSYQQLFLLYEKLKQQGLTLDTLSMGMSDDMEAAIAEGSTMVRIGTAIFGLRI